MLLYTSVISIDYLEYIFIKMKSRIYFVTMIYFYQYLIFSIRIMMQIYVILFTVIH